MSFSGYRANGAQAKALPVQKVWLLEENPSQESTALCEQLRKLSEKPYEEIAFLGSSKIQVDPLNQVRNRSFDVLVIHEASWPIGKNLKELTSLEVGFLVAASKQNVCRFQELAETRSLAFVPSTGGLEAIQVGLYNLAISLFRDRTWQARVDQLQSRLNDRIIIERAKGILVQTLNITEEEAYKRLRLSSRRHRRQIRDIAQSLLDTQSLLSFEEISRAESDNQVAPQAQIEKI
ncbi:MAG TPA: ANTAR domain-containing protein [Gemmataceae bacterium]|jgi:hypothetical protein|nr:ANTAR domain-containing protein [Gemmataceae bacterium]